MNNTYYNQHSKIGDGGETFNTIIYTECNQQIPKTSLYYHIRTNAHKLNCAVNIRNDDYGVGVDDDEVKHVGLVFLSRIKFKVVKFLRNMEQKKKIHAG